MNYPLHTSVIRERLEHCRRMADRATPSLRPACMQYVEHYQRMLDSAEIERRAS